MVGCHVTRNRVEFAISRVCRSFLPCQIARCVLYAFIAVLCVYVQSFAHLSNRDRGVPCRIDNKRSMLDMGFHEIQKEAWDVLRKFQAAVEKYPAGSALRQCGKAFADIVDIFLVMESETEGHMHAKRQRAMLSLIPMERLWLQ